MEATDEQLRTLIVERFDVARDRIRPETNLVSDLGATSLDIVDFLMAIEERLGIKIEDSEAEAMRTFTDAVEIVESKRRFPLQ